MFSRCCSLLRPAIGFQENYFSKSFRQVSVLSSGRKIAARSLASTNIDVNKLSTHVSIVEHPYSINGVPLESQQFTQTGMPTPSLFAVIGLSGSQFKITQDDVIKADLINGVDIGDIVTIDDVYLLGSRAGTVVGRPMIPGVKVQFEVEEITKDKKVVIFKMRRRKHSRRTRGFRADLTILRCKDIIIPDQFASALSVPS